jgi:hypothetical protein
MNRAPIHHTAGAKLNVNFGFTASVKSRHNLALQHLWNARHAARQCRDREADLASLNYRLPEVELTGTAMVAVMSSVAFLEALVNEVYLDTVDADTGSTDRLKGIGDDAIAAMRDRWNATPSVEREGILDKYKIALECAGKTMALGRDPAQSVKVLIDLRDALTHYKPEWQGDDTELFAELRRRLPVNKRVAELNPWFPHQALSADCAEWACKNSVALAKEWWRDMGLVRDSFLDLKSWKTP